MAKAKTGTPKKSKYSKKQLLEWYEMMLLIRRFEEKASTLYMQQKFRGFLHLAIGQEAANVGLEAAIRPDDQVITAYRDHGNGLARGMEPRVCMAEMFGKSTGSSKGKGGSMHFFSKEHHFYGGHGIVGAQIPLGAGLAFANKYRDEDKIAVCLMGDGATRQGALHEAFNLAMTWKLPVLYIIENNQYAMGTSVERTSNVTKLYELGESYDMPSKAINGMDVINVYEELKKAVAHVRSGKGPYLVEILTYRYRGHSMSDPAKYRTREELNKYKGKDPIANLKLYIGENGIDAQKEIAAIEAKIKEIVNEAATFADESPLPDPSELYDDIYVGDYPFIMD